MKRYLLLISVLAAFVAEVAAREVYRLNDDWTFYFRSENSADDARNITLPHTWNLDALAGNSEYQRTTGNYMRRLYIPEDWASKRLFLRFDGVQTVADVFVNGYHVGEHRGGFTAFTLEITGRVKFGAENHLLVVVSNTFQNDVLPTSTEQNVYGGIYRDVDLILTDKVAVSPAVWGTDGLFIEQMSVDGDRVEGRAMVYVSAPKELTAQITLTVRDPDGYVVVEKAHRDNRTADEPVAIPFAVDAPRLWSPAAPNLYTVTARVVCDSLADEVTVRTGFRRIAASGGGLLVNGDTVRLHGVALYHDRASVANAFAATDYDEDLAFVRDVGANAVHSVSGPHDQYLYDRLDEQGLMAWIDLPLMRSPYLGDVFYFPTERFRANGREQLREIVAQNFNHPSVAMWGIFSLVWQRGDDVTPYVRELHTAVRQADPSRPTVALSNQDGELNTITDLVALRQNVGWTRGSTDDVAYWCETLHQSWGNLLAAPCYGVPGYPSQQDDLLGRPTPGTHWLPERWQTRFHEEYARRIVSDPAFWGEWINAMFDFGTARGANDRNACGLVTLDRRQKKDAYYLYRTLWNRCEPTLYIAERRWNVRPDAEQQIKVYSSGDDPVLLVNGDSVALTKYAEGQFRADCVLLPGENRIEARCGRLRDSVSLRVGTALKARDFEALRKTKGLRSKD